jgi:hypothetical protein
LNLGLPLWLVGNAAIDDDKHMNTGLMRSNEIAILQIASLRLAVGLLGERDAAGWWPSGFMSPTSAAFLAPVFGSRVLQARYQGVLEAASLRRCLETKVDVFRAVPTAA